MEIDQGIDFEIKLLQTARPSCAENCSLAQAKAKLGARYVVSGITSLELAQDTYADAVMNCTGPEVIKVCGAPEGEKTYACKSIGRLATLEFEK